MNDPWYEHENSKGCTLSLGPGEEHLGKGVMLHLQMRQPGDGRRAEVWLDTETLAWLQDALDTAEKKMDGWRE